MTTDLPAPPAVRTVDVGGSADGAPGDVVSDLDRRQRLVRFLLVGGVGFVINTAIVALLVAVDVPDLLASVVATETAIVANYLGHERFTFGTRRLRLRRFLGYNASALVGLVITSVAFTLLRDAFDWPLVVVNLVAVACGTGSNFLLSSRLVWRG